MRMENRKPCIFCDTILPDDISDLKQLVNKKIVNIGFIKTEDNKRGLDVDSVEGGLIIDYEDENKTKRIVLGFTELGMWIHWQGEKGSFGEEDKLRLKLESFFNSFSWGSASMIDDPKKLCFNISDGKSTISLSINELKIINKKYPRIMEIFSKEEKDVDEVLSIISDFCYLGDLR